MDEPKLFEDPTARTALTLRVTYDAVTGMARLYSAMHHADTTPLSLPRLKEINVDRTGWWALRNEAMAEIATYAECESKRANIHPF